MSQETCEATLGSVVGKRRIIFIEEYDFERTHVGRRKFTENRRLYWVLCQCGDIRPLERRALLKSQKCQQCTRQQNYAKLVSKEKRTAKRKFFEKQTPRHNCIRCRAPSQDLTCDKCKAKPMVSPPRRYEAM